MSDQDQVATITLNRPQLRNAQSPITWTALTSVVNALPGTVRVLVLRGDGPAFSAGLDRRMLTQEGIPGVPNLAALAGAPLAEATAEIATYQAGFEVFARPGQVSIALVHGHAVGAGFQLALACDLRIAAEDAQFTMAEVGLGLVPDLGGTKRLVELVGYSRAAAICLTGARVPATQALQLGLVASVVPGDQLAAAGRSLVERILAQPRTAVSEIKALLLQAADRGQTEQERAEREAQYRQLRLLAGHPE
ncbi:MAG TPA: enoyl-CoA hydratase/isomerase family protein [Jatrophihabitans sp.]|nr:enoyl-CoA hydratase/isomerase family protein [Jatrophihabitans sp.]